MTKPPVSPTPEQSDEQSKGLGVDQEVVPLRSTNQQQEPQTCPERSSRFDPTCDDCCDPAGACALHAPLIYGGPTPFWLTHRWSEELDDYVPRFRVIPVHRSGGCTEGILPKGQKNSASEGGA